MSAKNQIPRFATVEDVIDELKPGYPVYCLRPHELKRQAEYFLDTFPGRVMYAVKCNPHLVVLQALYAAGIRLSMRFIRLLINRGCAVTAS